MIRKYLGLIKKIGSEILELPQYYIPYLFHGGKAKPPRRVDFELTYTCNLKCQFCPQELFKSKLSPQKIKKDELKTSEICKVMDELERGGVSLVTLTGGEPFVRKDIMEIIRHVKQTGMSLGILSNGALLTEKIAYELVNIGVDSITFSLDGPQKLHDIVRGIPNTYERMTKAVSYIVKARKELGKTRPYINFNCTISALNQSEFSKIIDTASELGVDSVSFGFLFFTNKEAVAETAKIMPILQAKEEDQILPEHIKAVDIKILEEEISRCKEKAKEQGVPVSFNPALQGEELREYFYNYEYSYTNKCFFPWKVSRVNPEGTVYPCSIDMNMGNVKGEKFFEIWNGKNYITLRNTLKKNKLFPKCNKCCELQSKVWSILP